MPRINHAARSRQLLAEVDSLVAPLAGVIAERRAAAPETAAERYGRLSAELETVAKGSPRWWELYSEATAAKVEMDREWSTERLRRRCE